MLPKHTKLTEFKWNSFLKLLSIHGEKDPSNQLTKPLTIRCLECHPSSHFCWEHLTITSYLERGKTLIIHLKLEINLTWIRIYAFCFSELPSYCYSGNLEELTNMKLSSRTWQRLKWVNSDLKISSDLLTQFQPQLIYMSF